MKLLTNDEKYGIIYINKIIFKFFQFNSKLNEFHNCLNKFLAITLLPYPYATADGFQY